MKVKELLNLLNDFDKDAEIVLGVEQRYGGDFAINIESVSTEKVAFYDGDTDNHCVVITEGRQIGSVKYED